MKLLKLISNLLGINPRAILALRFLPRYFTESKRFSVAGGIIEERFPILTDYKDCAGVAKGHYFHQDLLIAQKLFMDNPERHVDIGSRIDGFVAHVASFREIELFDIRPMRTKLKNITFKVQNLVELSDEYHGYSDSVSCLHALEHFGLGRYGDPIDPQGHMKGFNNLLKLTRRGGKLYISVPIGRRRTVFNAHRIFSPYDLIHLSTDKAYLENYAYVDDHGDLWVEGDIQQLLSDSENLEYGLGIYEFRKLV